MRISPNPLFCHFDGKCFKTVLRFGLLLVVLFWIGGNADAEEQATERIFQVDFELLIGDEAFIFPSITVSPDRKAKVDLSQEYLYPTNGEWRKSEYAQAAVYVPTAFKTRDLGAWVDFHLEELEETKWGVLIHCEWSHESQPTPREKVISSYAQDSWSLANRRGYPDKGAADYLVAKSFRSLSCRFKLSAGLGTTMEMPLHEPVGDATLKVTVVELDAEGKPISLPATCSRL